MPRNSLLRLVIIEIVYVLMIPMNILLKLVVVPLAKFTKPEWEYFVPLMQIVVLYLLNNDIYISIKLFLTIHCFFGFIFAKVTFGGHRIQ